MTSHIEVGVRAGVPMDFPSFLAWSARVAEIMGVERLCETRIARAYSDLQPNLSAAECTERLHRCDIVRLWCTYHGIPATRLRNTLACEGVRHALQIIFTKLADRATAVGIPSDVYPVYWKLAASANIHARAFPTFPQFDLEATLADLGKADITVVLLPQPLKLQGRSWSEDEAAIAEDWLSKRRGRRIILDGVYAMGAPLDPLLRRLIESDRVILLDSLSKGWLHEHIFGVAVVPDTDLDLYSGSFRALTPSNHKLSMARELLSQAPDLPSRIALDLERRRAHVMGRLSELRLTTLPVRRGYLLPIEAGAEELLTEHSLLTIPASVFGSSLTGWSIASVLPSPSACA